MKTFLNKKLQILLAMLFAFIIAAPAAGAATITASLAPTFQADLTNTLKLQKGTGLPTFTRATTAYVTDWEGLMKPVLSGEARFMGARRVANILTSPTENFSAWNNVASGVGSNPTVTGGQTDPLGRNTAFRLQTVLNGGAAGGDFSGISSGTSIPLASGNSYQRSIWVKSNTGSSQTFTFVQGGAVQKTATTQWTRVALEGGDLVNANGFTMGSRGSFQGDVDILIWHPMIEIVTGQSNQNPSEYVSVGVAASPYYGAGVDGVQYFNTLNGNTVASSIVTAGAGGKINSSAPGASSATTDSVGPLGYFAEGTRTNLALQSEDFGTTWANVTVTLTPDSVTAPNGATTADTLLSQGPGSRMNQTITAPSTGAYTYSVYIKPGNTTTETIILRNNTTATNYSSVLTLTGSGSASSPGGGATATITPVKNGFYLAAISVPSGFTAGDSAILYIYTGGSSSVAGDYVYAWGAQLEAAPFASSYIPTTTGSAPRNGDVLSYPNPSSANTGEGALSLYLEMNRKNNSGTSFPSKAPIQIGLYNTNAMLNFGGYGGTNGTLLVNFGATWDIASGPFSITYNTLARIALRLASNLTTFSAYKDGIKATDAVSASAKSVKWSGSSAVIFIANSGGADADQNITIRNVKIWKKALTDAQLTTMTSSNTTTARAAVPQTTVKAPTKTGLVGAWTFNEGTGTKANDSSGNGNSGTLIHSPTWENGKLGKALLLNNSNSYVSVPSVQALKYTGGGMTLETWIYPNIGETAATFISKPWNGSGVYNYQLTYGPVITFYVRGATACSINSGANTAPQGSWHHIVATIAIDETMNLYIDGRLVGSGACGIVDWTPSLGDLNLPLSIGTLYPYGAGAWDQPTHAFGGKMDNVRFYKRALSSAEVQQAYKQNATQINSSKNDFLTNGLVGLWSFDGKDMNWGTGTAFDRSGNSRNGSLVGMSTTTSPVIGKIGQALRFTGNNRVSLISVNPASFVTVAGWFKRSGVSTNTHHILFMQDTQIEISIPESTGQIRVGVTTATLGRQVFDSGSGLTDNKWHFLSMTYDGVNLRAYIDGVQTGILGVTGSLNTGGATNIGSYGGSYYANGLIDDVRVYSRALSTTEIKQLYNLGK